MACQLRPAPPGSVSDFVTKAGQPSTIFAANDSDTVHLNAATLNSQALNVANGRVTFTPIAGRNLLNLNFVGADPTEVFEIREDCGGTSNVVDHWRLQPGPAGEPGGPTKAYQIHATA